MTLPHKDNKKNDIDERVYYRPWFFHIFMIFNLLLVFPAYSTKYQIIGILPFIFLIGFYLSIMNDINRQKFNNINMSLICIFIISTFDFILFDDVLDGFGDHNNLSGFLVFIVFIIFIYWAVNRIIHRDSEFLSWKNKVILLIFLFILSTPLAIWLFAVSDFQEGLLTSSLNFVVWWRSLINTVIFISIYCSAIFFIDRKILFKEEK